MTTIAPERTVDNSAIERSIASIEQSLDQMRRGAADCAMRRDNATAAGNTLAQEVYRFLEDPEGVGTDALRRAYRTFMGRSSGNFTDSVMEYGDDRQERYGSVPDRMPRG